MKVVLCAKGVEFSVAPSMVRKVLTELTGPGLVQERILDTYPWCRMLKSLVLNYYEVQE